MDWFREKNYKFKFDRLFEMFMRILRRDGLEKCFDGFRKNSFSGVVELEVELN